MNMYTWKEFFLSCEFALTPFVYTNALSIWPRKAYFLFDFNLDLPTQVQIFREELQVNSINFQLIVTEEQNSTLVKQLHIIVLLRIQHSPNPTHTM